jgi:hypothetical protein
MPKIVDTTFRCNAQGQRTYFTWTNKSAPTLFNTCIYYIYYACVNMSRTNFKAANLLDLKYVDDMTLAEAVNLKDELVIVPESDRPLPDPYNALPGEKTSFESIT